MQRVLSILLLIVLAAAGAWSIVLARADRVFREGSPESIARASEMLPASIAYASLQALQTEYDGGDAAAEWQRIAELHPRASAPRIRLGLLAEQSGDGEDAERWLLAAYTVDHQFEPRWTLANFYLRRGDSEQFWRWMRSALEVSPGDQTPVFDLCWRAADDPAEILTVLPDRAEVRRDYLRYVTARRPEAIVGASEQVTDGAALWAATDVLIDAGRIDEAAIVWQRSGRRKPSGITGARFEAPQTGHGFDWRTSAIEGVSQLNLDGERGYRLRFSGRQPEEAELLRQAVTGLAPQARYRLKVATEGDAIPGLEWRVDGKAVSGEFVSAGDSVTLSLWYRRPLGEVRAEGVIDLKEVTIERF